MGFLTLWRNKILGEKLDIKISFAWDWKLIGTNCHKIWATGLLSWENVSICFRKPKSFTSYHTIPITLSPWPSSSLLLLVQYFLISAPLSPHHHLFLSLSPSAPVRATVLLPACLCWYGPLSLPLSMYFALIRREHRQTVLTAWARRGCYRAMERGWCGEEEGGGTGCRANTLLSMTPNKTTEIGTGGNRRWGEGGEAGDWKGRMVVTGGRWTYVWMLALCVR